MTATLLLLGALASFALLGAALQIVERRARERRRAMG
jgi:hypothetical protein